MEVILAIVVVAVIAVIVAAGFYLYQQNKRSEQLRERFGPEYDRTVSTAGKGSGERELKQRADRVDSLDIRELSSDERRSYSERWKTVQADFVDRPESAIHDADALVQEVMSARGYPVADFEQRTADLSVQHADVIEHYRQAHAISESHRESPRSTEDLRQAMIHYRALFSELLGEVGTRP